MLSRLQITRRQPPGTRARRPSGIQQISTSASRRQPFVACARRRAREQPSPADLHGFTFTNSAVRHASLRGRRGPRRSPDMTLEHLKNNVQDAASRRRLDSKPERRTLRRGGSPTRPMFPPSAICRRHRRRASRGPAATCRTRNFEAYIPPGLRRCFLLRARLLRHFIKGCLRKNNTLPWKVTYDKIRFSTEMV